MAVCDVLGDDGYGGMIRDGLQRLAGRIEDAAEADQDAGS